MDEQKLIQEKALYRAIKTLGSARLLGEAIGCKPARVGSWRREGNRIPAEWVIPVEKATGVSRHLLRPDIYPVEE